MIGDDVICPLCEKYPALKGEVACIGCLEDPLEFWLVDRRHGRDGLVTDQGKGVHAVVHRVVIN